MHGPHKANIPVNHTLYHASLMAVREYLSNLTYIETIMGEVLRVNKRKDGFVVHVVVLPFAVPWGYLVG